jgi:hypothetical protein
MKLVNEILVTSLEGRLWPKANVIKLLHNKLELLSLASLFTLLWVRPEPYLRVEPNVCG